MIQLGDVIAKIRADTTEFNKGLNDAKGSVSDFKSHLSTVGGGIEELSKKAVVFTAAVVGTVAALSAGAFKLAESAAKYNSIADSFNSMSEGMGITATELEQRVNKASAGTIDRLTTLQGATRALSLIGKDAFGNFGDDFAKMAELSKKAARATGQDVNFMFDSLILGVSRNSKLILDNLGINLDAEQAYKDYAESLRGSSTAIEINSEKTAKNEAKLSKLKGQLVIAEMRMNEFTDSTKASTKAAAEMKLSDLRNQIAGLEGNTIAYVGSGGRAADSLTEQEKKAALLRGALKALEENYGNVEVTAGGLQGAMQRLRTTLADARIEIGQELEPVFNNLIRAIQPLIDKAIPVIVEGLKKISEEYGPKVKQFFEDLKLKIEEIKISDEFRAFVDKMKDWGDWIKENKELIKDFLTGVAIGIGSLMILGTITMLLGLITNPLLLIIGLVGLLYTAWKTNFGGIRDITEKVVNDIMGFFNVYLIPAVTAVKDWFVKNWDEIRLVLETQWALIKGIIQIAWSIISGIIKVGLAILSGDWRKAWDAIKDTVSGVWEGIKTIFDGIVEFILHWGEKILDHLTKPFKDAFDGIKGWVDKIKEKADEISPFHKESPSLVEQVGKGVGMIKDYYRGLEDISLPSIPALASTSNSMENNSFNINVNLNGNVGSSTDAEDYGEAIGDAIVRKLMTSRRGYV